jgi:cell division protein FtsZ
MPVDAEQEEGVLDLSQPVEDAPLELDEALEAPVQSDELAANEADYGHGSGDPLPPPPRVASGGGTLFERMSNLSRGLGRGGDDKDDAGEPEGNINIPRFLDRQSNN